jgi:hypothetical protein
VNQAPHTEFLTVPRAGILDLTEADAIKDDWKQNHRFRIKAASFGELL